MNCNITLVTCVYIVVLSSLGTYIGCKLYKYSKPTKLTTPCNCQYEKMDSLTEEDYENDEKEDNEEEDSEEEDSEEEDNNEEEDNEVSAENEGHNDREILEIIEKMRNLSKPVDHKGVEELKTDMIGLLSNIFKNVDHSVVKETVHYVFDNNLLPTLLEQKTNLDSPTEDVVLLNTLDNLKSQ
jgi:cobalamin biosynthesis protein CobT